MSESFTKPDTFDVFLCHNNEDKPEVRDIAQQLSRNGIAPWLDEEQIQPGTCWQTALGDQLDCIKSAVVFAGESGLGPWQNQEVQALLSQFITRKCPVIPVILPSATKTPDLPWTLKNFHWVDFRVDQPDPMKQLIWGVTGKKPDESPVGSNAPNAEALPEEELFPPQKTKVIEIRLPGNIDEFSDKEKAKFLQSVKCFLEVGEVKLSCAVSGSIRVYLEMDSENADKLYSEDKKGRLAGLGIAETRLYPAIVHPPDREQRRQLLILLERVNEFWIDGALKDSLHHQVLISLGKRSMEQAVEPLWKHCVKLPRQCHHLALQNPNIKTVFDASGLLLILGQPGSGKTTTLLELAADLVLRARKDSKERVPIVLNLSSWNRTLSLTEWMARELSVKYRVPMTIGRRWLMNGYLVPLLDGLDEVQTGLQPACVAAINEFIGRHEIGGLVVCCRLMEYKWLPERLKLNGAICLESLDAAQVENTLNRAGDRLTGLRKAIGADPVLQELSRTPLMLNIMSLAYEGHGKEHLRNPLAGSSEERREQIFRLYVEQMFERKAATVPSRRKNKIMRMLTCLAKDMKQRSQSVFMVEGLQPNRLKTRGQRALCGALTALIIGLGAALIYVPMAGLEEGLGIWVSISMGIGVGCWTDSRFKNGIRSALIAGLLYALIVSSGNWVTIINQASMIGLTAGLLGGAGAGPLQTIRTIESLHWSWRQFWRKAVIGWKTALLVAAATALLFGLAIGQSIRLGRAVESALIFGLFFGTISLVLSGLLGGLADTIKAGKVKPNQGIKLSLKNAAISLGLTGLIVGLIPFLVIVWIEQGDLETGLKLGAVVGMLVGLSGGLNRGGAAAIKHYCLRLILRAKGHVPIMFTKSLDHCARLIILKKVGGGYMFIHRMLLEHFASKKPE